MVNFNAKKSREPWVRGNIREFFTSLLVGQRRLKRLPRIGPQPNKAGNPRHPQTRRNVRRPDYSRNPSVSNIRLKISRHVSKAPPIGRNIVTKRQGNIMTITTMAMANGTTAKWPRWRSAQPRLGRWRAMPPASRIRHRQRPHHQQQWFTQRHLPRVAVYPVRPISKSLMA